MSGNSETATNDPITKSEKYNALLQPHNITTTHPAPEDLHRHRPIPMRRLVQHPFTSSCQRVQPVVVTEYARQQINPQVQGQDAVKQTNIALPAAELRSVSISTESGPSLLKSNRKTEPSIKFVTQNCLIKTPKGWAVAPSKTFQFTDKTASTSNDTTMQKLLEALNEDHHSPKVSSKPKSLIKMKSPEPKVPPASIEKDASQPQVDTNSLRSMLSSVYRASYNPPQKHSDGGKPPSQLQVIPCFRSMIQNLLRWKTLPSKEPINACNLRIPRFPIKCPQFKCHKLVFVSGFCEHFIMNHSIIPIEHIMPQECKNFLLNVKLTRFATTQCHVVYLIRDKIVGLGSGKFKDVLPMVLMTAWVNLLDLCKVDQSDKEKYSKNAASNGEYLVMWFTGIVPEDYPVQISFAVWSQHGKEPVGHRVYSGDVYSLRRKQNVAEVLESSKALLISFNEVQMLTNNEKEPMKLQIVVQ